MEMKVKDLLKKLPMEEDLVVLIVNANNELLFVGDIVGCVLCEEDEKYSKIINSEVVAILNLDTNYIKILSNYLI